MSKKSSTKVSQVLIDAMDAELKEVTRKWKRTDTIPEGKKEGEFVYSTVERMRVIDRSLKLEALRVKEDAPAFGSAFGKTSGGNDEE